MGVLVIEIGEGFGLEANAGERGAEFVGDGGEERLERARSFGIAPVEVSDEGEAEEKGGEEGGSFPEDHSLGPEPLAFGGGVGDAQLFFEPGDFARLGEHEENPPSAEGDDEGQPEGLETDQELLIGGPMAVFGMAARPDHGEGQRGGRAVSALSGRCPTTLFLRRDAAATFVGFICRRGYGLCRIRARVPPEWGVSIRGRVLRRCLPPRFRLGRVSARLKDHRPKRGGWATQRSHRRIGDGG